MTPEELKRRTKEFAIRVVKLVQHLEKDGGLAGVIIGRQLIRSGTGIFSNYRAACRAKSAKDFISKMGTVVEEADETLGWLELLVGVGVIKLTEVETLIKEADEITAIMTSSHNSAIQNQYNKKREQNK